MKQTSYPAHPSNYHRGRVRPIRVVVVHDGETGEGPTPAEGMGAWFANAAANASAHAGSDTDSTCRYVADKDTAWAAPGANADGLQLELAGRASQTAAQWDDADSRRILDNGARQVASWCRIHRIPARWLTDAQLADGRTRGLVTHRQVSRVFGLSSHTDPGPNFPAAAFLARVQFHLGQAPPVTSRTDAKPLAVDGDRGPATVRAIERWLGVPARGTWTSWDVRALQRRLRVTVTGKADARTVRALQTHVGAVSDGVWGPATTRALQSYLNRIGA